MTIHHPQRGAAGTLVLVILALVVVIGGAYWYSSRDAGEASPEATASISPPAGTPTPTEAPTTDASPTQAPSASNASVREYTKASYDTAVSSGKPVVLYYYANWCPICAVEYPKFVTAVNTFDADAATFFRVNYNDSETTDEEEASAREHQVGYQHTIVVVKNGQQTYKSMATGDYEARIRAEIQ